MYNVKKLWWIPVSGNIDKNLDSYWLQFVREYVAAAHLAPLNKADKEKKCSTWNTMVNKHSSSE